jgi:SAM-dependent methyltransferase
MTTELRDRTIADFGEQWSVYTDNSGYYGSQALLEDVVGPLLDVSTLRGVRAADIGAGTGRFTNILLQCGARQVIAVEPSDAFEALVENTAQWGERVEHVRTGGEEFRPPAVIDFAFSYGVVHHIPDPEPVVRAVFNALRPGGRFCVWVYGRENNGAYVWLLKIASTITIRLPHTALAAVVWVAYWPLVAYMTLCRSFDLPLAGYMREVFAKLSPAKRRLTMYDQLNPAYAKYYRQHELVALLTRAGFQDVRVFHRHGYSWTALATKP